jgi:hypothetical protein
VADNSDADSMLRFRLERRGDGMNHCRKMKRRQRAHLDSMGRKYDTVWWRGDISRRRGTQHRGGEMKEMMLVRLT